MNAKRTALITTVLAYILWRLGRPQRRVRTVHDMGGEVVEIPITGPENERQARYRPVPPAVRHNIHTNNYP